MTHKIYKTILACTIIYSLSSLVSAANTIDVQQGAIPVIDGNITDGEWSDANTVTFSADGGTATVYYKQDGSNLYLGFDIPNDNPGGKIQVYLDTLNDKDSVPQSDDYMIILPYNGSEHEHSGDGSGTWDGGTYSITGWTASKTNKTGGWEAEFNITYSKLNVSSGVSKTIGLGFAWFYLGGVYYGWPDAQHYYKPNLWGNASSTDNWKATNVASVSYGFPPVMDGDVDPDDDWIDAKNISFATVGGNTTVHYKHDGTSLYFGFDIPNNLSETDVMVIIDSEHDGGSGPDVKDYELTVDIDGSILTLPLVA